ncbi:MAG: glycoside hydrolase family 3 N-terminal domain-containing protein [Candidatus Nanopelagicales bacterium]
MQRASIADNGIPFTVSSDPRHSFTDNPGTGFLAGPFSQWPEPLGFAATRDEDLVRRWADTIRREYLAVGIRVALHPQIDLATEPRWSRQSSTFGEDAALTSRLGVAYVEGLQGDSLGPASVAAMAKHFPGGGPQKDGEDPHFDYGKEQVYPGGRFDLHLEPFEAVIAAGVSQLMPYYGVPVGIGLDEVGFSFNREIVTGLLRERLGFDGIVCSDWGILTLTPWGVEDLAYEDRMLRAFDAGVDQLGGEHSVDVLLDLVAEGRITEERIDASARRVLREKVRLGLLDSPLVDVDATARLVGAAEAREAGRSAQAAACTVLRNDAGAAALPLREGLRVYAEGFATEAFGGRAEVVESPELADVAVLRIAAPWEPRSTPGTLEPFFHAGSLDFPVEEVERVRGICRQVPTVLVAYLDRPAILTEIAADAATLVVDFGCEGSVLVDVLLGERTPRGRLPFDLPSSMAAVEASRPDVPFDTEAPLFRFGDGLDI